MTADQPSSHLSLSLVLLGQMVSLSRPRFSHLKKSRASLHSATTILALPVTSFHRSHFIYMASDILPKRLKTILKVGVVARRLSRFPTDGLTGDTLIRFLELHLGSCPKILLYTTSAPTPCRICINAVLVLRSWNQH